MKILNYEEHNLCNLITSEFIVNLNEAVLDNDSEIINILMDMNLNKELSNKFGLLVKNILPIVSKLLDNSKLNIVKTNRMLILLTLSSIMVYYLEQRKQGKVEKVNGYDTDDKFRDEIRFILEEMKMLGVGNGIVKKISECIESISNIIFLIFEKDQDANIFNIINDVSLNKVSHSIDFIVGKHKMNIDSFLNNFILVNHNLSSQSGIKSLSEIFTKLNIVKAPISSNNKHIIDIDASIDPTIGEIIMEETLGK